MVVVPVILHGAVVAAVHTEASAGATKCPYGEFSHTFLALAATTMILPTVFPHSLLTTPLLPGGLFKDNMVIAVSL